MPPLLKIVGLGLKMSNYWWLSFFYNIIGPAWLDI